MSKPYAIYHRTAVVIAVTCGVTTLMLLAMDSYDWARNYSDGLIIGTVFMSTMLAAAWTAFGPGRLLIRLPLSLAWGALMGLSIDLPLSLVEGPRQFGYFLLLTSALWLVAQVPFWGVANFFHLKLHHQGTTPSASDERSGQFGIRELMVFTALVAVLLGLGRWLLQSVPNLFSADDELKFWGFLFVSQIAISVPLICATLLPRRVFAGILVSLLLIAGFTAVQSPLATQIMGGSPNDEFSLFIGTNFASIFWVFVFAPVIRFSGYHLAYRRAFQSWMRYKQGRRSAN